MLVGFRVISAIPQERISYMFQRLKAILKRKIRNAVGYAELWDIINKQTGLLDNMNKRTELLDNIHQQTELLDNVNRQAELLDNINKQMKSPPLPVLDEFESYIANLETIGLETTNHCTYRCRMCPHGSMSRPKGFMSKDDLVWVLDNVAAYRKGFGGIVDLANMGEAFLDKQLPEKVECVRKKLPNARIRVFSTLGSKFEETFLDRLVDSGLSHLTISCYGIDEQSYCSVHGVDGFSKVMGHLPKVARLVEKNKLEVLFQGPFETDDKDDLLKFKQHILSFGFMYYDSVLHNYGKMKILSSKRSLKPCPAYNGFYYRGLWVDWDLKLKPCCFVTNQEVIYGDLREKCLREIFYDLPWKNHREALKCMNFKDNFQYCHMCHQDSSSYWLLLGQR